MLGGFPPLPVNFQDLPCSIVCAVDGLENLKTGSNFWLLWLLWPVSWGHGYTEHCIGFKWKIKCGQKSASGILYPKIAVHSCCLLHLPVAPTAPVERRLFDCYELGDVIGNGGFGSVYSGTSRATGDTVSPQGRHWTGQGQDMTRVVLPEVAIVIWVCFQ